MRIAEEYVANFDGTKVLDETILQDICHINHYTPIEEEDSLKFYQYYTVLPNVESKQITVPLYMVASAIDWLEKYDEDKKILERAFQVLEASHIKKVMDDMFHTFLASGADRNLVVFDSEHDKFDPHLVDLMIQTGEDNQSPITHLIISPEAHEDVNCVKEINDIKLLVLDQLGEKQDYQLFYENQLEGTFSGTSKELIIGIAYGKDGAMILQPNTQPLKLELQDKFTNDLGLTRYGAFLTTCATGYVCEKAKVILGSF